VKCLKLTVEEVPLSSRGKSLSQLLPKSRWKQIRERVYVEHGQRCAICEAKREDRRLDCHEVWEYDDEEHIQRLRDFIALCHLCHSAKHGLFLYRQPSDPDGACLARMLESVQRARAAHEKQYRIELGRHPALRDPRRVRSLRRAANRKCALEHFMQVNECDLVSGERHILEALTEWRRRSRLEWRVDFGEYGELLET
jgi:hypothetical protein